jgi:predicted secreted protein
MTVLAKIGYGATIKRNGVVMAEVKNITCPNLSTDMVDVTTMDSADSYKESIPSLKDGGEVGIEALFYAGDPAQAGMYTDFNASTKQNYIITAPDLSWTWTFSGYVTAIEQEIPMDDAIGVNFTIKVSGKPVLGTTAVTGITAMTVREQTDAAEATAANYMPTWAVGTFWYAVTYTTATAARIRVTLAALHTCKLYVDDVYLETLNDGVSSSAITMAADSSKNCKLVVESPGKTPLVYHATIARIS